MVNKILVIFVLLTLYSCLGEERKTEQFNVNSNTKKEKQSHEKKIDTVTLSKKIDSVKVVGLFFGEYRDKAFTLYLSNNYVKGVFHHKEKKNFTVNSLSDRNKLVKYINQFYIEESEKIILNRTKKEYIVSSDYPYIQVISYKDGKELFKNKTQIGEENYNIEYNPRFLEFYKFLDYIAKKN